MKFEYKAYHNDIPDEELILDLKKVQKQLERTSLSMAEYDEHGKYHSSTVSRRFGTWNNALQKAGIEVRNEQQNETDLFANLQRVWIAKGCQPSRRDMDSHPNSHISSGAYLRRFGKWSVALLAFVEYINNNQNNSDNTASSMSVGETHKTSRDVNSRLRFFVLARDNFACCKCGASPAKDGGKTVLHVDHIIPYSKGGETVADNLQTLCSNCNLGKSNSLYEQKV